MSILDRRSLQDVLPNLTEGDISFTKERDILGGGTRVLRSLGPSGFVRGGF